MKNDLKVTHGKSIHQLCKGKHNFRFSHGTREATGLGSLYEDWQYVICTECGELRRTKKEEIIEDLKEAIYED